MKYMKVGLIAGTVAGAAIIPIFIALGVHSTDALLIFWPTSIIGFVFDNGFPWTWGTKLFVWSSELLGNALIYACVGAAIGKIAQSAMGKMSK